MMKWVDQLTRITSEALARKMNRRDAIRKVAGTVIGTLVSVALFEGKANAAPCDQCQVWYSDQTSCVPPNLKYCSGCGSTAGSCPSGYQKSTAWGYSSTGCWCVTPSPSGYTVCCDCTPTATPGTKSNLDCGCSWSYAQSGYCIGSTSPVVPLEQ